MSEHALLTVITILATIGCALLSILVVSMRNFKVDNEKKHEEIWERVNHHWHNGGGNVVIPTPGTITESRRR